MANSEYEDYGHEYSYKLFDNLTPDEEAVHRSNLLELRKMIYANFTSASLFNNPTNPADAPMTFESLMGLCSWNIAAMPPVFAFDIFQQMYAGPGESEG